MENQFVIWGVDTRSGANVSVEKFGLTTITKNNDTREEVPIPQMVFLNYVIRYLQCEESCRKYVIGKLKKNGKKSNSN